MRLHTIVTSLTLFATALVAGCASTPSRQPVVQGASTLPVPVAIDPLQATVARLARVAPNADPGVLALALEARDCAVRNGEADAGTRLAVIDYSRPSTEKRLWVFDVEQGRLLYNEHVAHGSGSGERMATRFSNVDGTHATSLGLFRTAETYIGGNGYSLRLDGLDPGFNDNARARAIVMHGAWYADPGLIRTQGRLGRSQGCPALREGIARQVIDTLKGAQLVFSYADDAQWLQRGRSFACDGRSARQILADARLHAHPAGGTTLVAAAALSTGF